MQTSSSGEQLLELTTQSAAGLTGQQVTTLASILASLAGKLAENSSELLEASVNGGAPSLQLSEQQLNQISEEDELKLLNFPSRREDLSTAIPLTVIFALLLVTGCIGNICTAIVIARPKNKYMHTATNYYLFSLAMSDFLFLILGLPQEMYTLWQRYPYAFGESFCIIRGYLSEASTYASILTISAFTVERYVAICHPLWAHTMSQLPRAITSIVIIWCLAAICAIPPAAELGIVTQHGPITNRTLEQSAQCATKRTIYENMFVISAIVFFIVPMVIVTVLYILIAIELRQSSRMNNAITKQTSSQLHHAASQQQQQQLSSQTITSSSHHHHRHHCCAGQHQNYHLAKPKSQEQPQQQSDMPTNKKRERDAADRRLLDGLTISERPQSAIGVEQPARVEYYPELAADGQAAATHRRSKSPAAGSLARFQLPFASKLCHQILGAGFWSGYNLTATSLGPDEDDDDGDEARRRQRPSGGAEPAPEQQPVNPREARLGVAAECKERHSPVSRQHSPLSYHESLIQRGHPHSALDLSQHTGGAGGPAACHPHHRHHQFGLHHAAPHHQLSLTQLPTNHHQKQRQLLLLNHHHNFKPFHHHQHQHQQHSSRRSNAASSKKSVIRMLVAVVVSFFICWVPFHAQRLLASYLAKHENRNQLLLDIYLKLTYISGVMYYLSSTINPLLYQLMSAKFRLAFKETFKCSLFKCAIFRRASTATQATAIGLNYSPTNSIRVSDQPASCSCQLAAAGPNPSARARFICELASGQAAPLGAAHKHQQRVSNSNMDLRHGLAQAGAAADCCCLRCCCCQLQQPAPMAPGVLSRFRGQLNASLTSLLKWSLSGDQRQAGGGHCACCTLNARPAENTDVDQRPSRARSSGESAEKRAGELSQAKSGRSQPAREPVAARRPQEEPGADVMNPRGLPTGARPEAAGAKQNNAESNTANQLQTSGFPTHHTMLKFIRSPTPTGLDGVEQPTSLTRLSSRDADDENDQLHGRDGHATGQSEHSNPSEPDQLDGIHRQHMSSGQRQAAMRALIRATKQEDDFGGQDESDPLVSTTLTTSGSLTNDGAISGAHSSVGSSPDQLGSTSQSTTNQARTLSSSSSRSSLALLASSHRGGSDLKAAQVGPAGRGVMGVLSSVKSAKRKLVGSKSSASPNSDSACPKRRAQLERCGSWQQQQQQRASAENDLATDRALTNQLVAEMALSKVNASRGVVDQVQFVDQNGNEREELAANGRDGFWPGSPLLATAQIGLNMQARASKRAPGKQRLTTTTMSDDDDKPPPSVSTNDSSSHSSGSSGTTRSHDGIPSDLLAGSAEADHALTLFDFGPIGI